MAFTDDLLTFLKQASTPFQTVGEISKYLAQKGFVQLAEKEKWTVKFPGKYFVVRQGSSLIAWHTSKQQNAPLHIVSGHTDAPALKVRPNAAREQHGYLKIGVEIYGGLLLSTWFDRALSLAGQVYFSAKGKPQAAVIDFKRPIGILPSLPIHLNREVNDRKTYQKQEELFPIIGQIKKGTSPEQAWHKILLGQIKKQYPRLKADKVISYDLMFYPCANNIALTGVNAEFIASPRLDNQISCFAAMQAITAAPQKHHNIMILTDHEECGSRSSQGADSNFLTQTLSRIWQKEDLALMLASSFLISCDNAHGVHPNYPSKYEAQHLAHLNNGPVLKTNFNQRYTTAGFSRAQFLGLCQLAKVDAQDFVTRGDIPCGSTIGPTLAAQLGIPATDVGVASWAMHSAVETIGTSDPLALTKVLKQFAQKSLPSFGK